MLPAFASGVINPLISSSYMNVERTPAAEAEAEVVIYIRRINSMFNVAS